MTATSWLPSTTNGWSRRREERTQPRLAARVRDEVSGDADEVGPALRDPRRGPLARAVAARERRAEVEVGEMPDAKAVERRPAARRRGTSSTRVREPAGLDPAVDDARRARTQRGRRAGRRASRHPRDARRELTTLRPWGRAGAACVAACSPRGSGRSSASRCSSRSFISRWCSARPRRHGRRPRPLERPPRPRLDRRARAPRRRPRCSLARDERGGAALAPACSPPSLARPDARRPRPRRPASRLGRRAGS